MTAPLLFALALHAAPEPPWLLVLATEGGSSNKGVGGVELRSSGQLWVHPALGPKCEAQATPAELRRLDLLVRSTKARYWKRRYVRADNPTGCCDQISTLLYLSVGAREGEKNYATGWFQDSRLLAPPDARTLTVEAAKVMRAHRCPRP